MKISSRCIEAFFFFRGPNKIRRPTPEHFTQLKGEAGAIVATLLGALLVMAKPGAHDSLLV